MMTRSNAKRRFLFCPFRIDESCFHERSPFTYTDANASQSSSYDDDLPFLAVAIVFHVWVIISDSKSFVYRLSKPDKFSYLRQSSIAASSSTNSAPRSIIISSFLALTCAKLAIVEPPGICLCFILVPTR